MLGIRTPKLITVESLMSFGPDAGNLESNWGQIMPAEPLAFSDPPHSEFNALGPSHISDRGAKLGTPAAGLGNFGISASALVDVQTQPVPPCHHTNVCTVFTICIARSMYGAPL